MIAPKEVFKLTPNDRNSSTWRNLMGHFNDKLASYRGSLEGDLDVAATAKVRGQISAIKALIALDRDEPITE